MYTYISIEAWQLQCAQIIMLGGRLYSEGGGILEEKEGCVVMRRGKTGSAVRSGRVPGGRQMGARKWTGGVGAWQGGGGFDRGGGTGRLGER